MKKSILTLLFLALLSCSSSDDSPTFDTKKMISDITNTIIVPKIKTFNKEAALLNDVINTFTNQVSTINLEAAKQQWKITAKAYANIYTFNIGPSRAQYYNLKLYNWPTNPNAIENFITNNATITPELITSFSTQVKSLSAIEYFIFNTNETSTLTSFEDGKRKQYLKLIAEELATNANSLELLWGSGDNYANTLIENTGTGIDASLNLIYNGTYNVIDTSKKTKVGKPAGLEKSSNRDPKLIQAQFSKTSIALLIENINSIEQLFFNTNGLGLSDKIASITKDDKLSNDLKSQLSATKSSLNAISNPLFDAITTNHDQVTAAYNEYKKLIVLLGNDVRSTLSIIITTTDTDGD